MSTTTSSCDDADGISFLAPYYELPIAVAKVEAPLKGKGKLTVGYGDSGWAPHNFYLREGQNVDVGVLKLFLSRNQVNLSHVAQSSPFVPSGGHSTTTPPPPPPPESSSRATARVKESQLVTRDPESWLTPWDIVEIPVVQRRANKTKFLELLLCKAII